jgi:hypothetical protein
MATWTTLPDASLEPGKPIRSIDGLALRDNPVAIAEGAVGAPRIVGAAAKRFENYDVLSVFAADTYESNTGSGKETLITQTANTANPPTVVAFRYSIQLYSGSMRFKCSHRQASSNSTSRLSVFKNNVLIQAYTTQSTSFVVRTNDISVSPGDVIEWRHSTSSSINISECENSDVFSSDSYTTIPLWISRSNLSTS